MKFKVIAIRTVCALALTTLSYPIFADGESPLRAVFLQAIRFDGKGSSFGGFSAIHIAQDGGRFVALSDRGTILTGRFLRDVTGSIQSIENGTVTSLRAGGSNWSSEDTIDSEGLAVAADGSVYVSFEGPAVVRNYNRIYGDGKLLPLYPPFSKLARNRALEALAIDRKGALFTIPEEPRAPTLPFPVYRFRNGVWSQPYSIAQRGNFLVADATFGPDDRFYVLEREFLGLSGFANRIRRFDLTTTGLKNEQTLLVTQAGAFGNLEGLGIWRSAGGLQATMVADDNFEFFLPSQIVEYRLPD